MRAFNSNGAPSTLELNIDKTLSFAFSGRGWRGAVAADMGRSGPRGNDHPRLSSWRSSSADVDTLARRRAMSRSASRMTEVDDVGLEVTSLVKRSRCSSRTTERA